MFEFHSSEYRVQCTSMCRYTAFQPVDHGDTRYDKAQTISPVQVQVQVQVQVRRVASLFFYPIRQKLIGIFFGATWPARRWAYAYVARYRAAPSFPNGCCRYCFIATPVEVTHAHNYT